MNCHYIWNDSHYAWNVTRYGNSRGIVSLFAGFPPQNVLLLVVKHLTRAVLVQLARVGFNYNIPFGYFKKLLFHFGKGDFVPRTSHNFLDPRSDWITRRIIGTAYSKYQHCHTDWLCPHFVVTCYNGDCPSSVSRHWCQEIRVNIEHSINDAAHGKDLQADPAKSVQTLLASPPY